MVDVLVAFLSQGQIPNTHNLKEQWFILAHGFSLCLAGSKTRTEWQRDIADKMLFMLRWPKQKTKERGREGDTPFQAMPPVIHLFNPTPLLDSIFSSELFSGLDHWCIVPTLSSHLLKGQPLNIRVFGDIF